MRVTTHGHYLTQLTRFPRLFPINAYFVREDDGLTLIDTAMGAASEIIKAAQSIGAPIRRIVITHAHSDHVGSLDTLKGYLPNAEVLTTARTARFLGGDRKLDPEEAQQGKLRGSFKTCTTQPDRIIAPGDRIGSLELIASPGHSPDHVSLFNHRDRSLIAGDAFQTRGGLAVSGVIRPLFPFPAIATWSKQSALSSARTLRALDPSRLAVGHGEVLETPNTAIDAAIATAARTVATQAARVR